MKGNAMKRVALALLIAPALTAFMLAQHESLERLNSGLDEGFGRVHMEITCSANVSSEFDRALALLHNFWYARALELFNRVIKKDPECAIAYWGAAMTYNHPFWD